MYDLIIRQGQVYDGTGAPARVADVAVKDGRVAAIGQLDDARSTETLTARNLLARWN